MGKNYYTMYDKEKKPEEAETPTAPEKEAKAPTTERRSTNKKAVVADCTCLNIRSMPDMRSSVLAVIDCGTELLVDEKSSDELWCSVKLKNGMKGHAMRKFLRLL